MSKKQMKADVSVGEESALYSKTRAEFAWKIIFVTVSIVAAILFKRVYVFQTHEYFKDIRCGNIWEMLLYGLPYAVLFTGFDLLIHHLLDGPCERHYITEQRYLSPESRKKRSYTLVKWGYSIVYYLISSVWAYKIIRETSFMPTWLGGSGDPFQLFLQAPSIPEVTFQMKVFYILQFGKHLSRLLGHFFLRSQGNFFEFALHHGVSVFLISFSYLTNQWLIGIFVLLIHDCSDLVYALARFYKDYRYCREWVLSMLYLLGVVGWLGGRIFLLAYCCIYASLYSLMYVLPQSMTVFEQETLAVCYGFMSAMLAVLQVLQCYWTYFLLSFLVNDRKNAAKQSAAQ